MRKRMIDQDREAVPDGQWLDLEHLAQVEISSEDAGYRIEAALMPGNTGWRAAQPGEQTIRFTFDRSQRIQRIRLVFKEDRQNRTQEFSLAWSTEGAPASREIIRQQYNFSPPHNTREVEDYQVDLPGVKTLELRLCPDISGGDVHASLTLIQIA